MSACRRLPVGGNGFVVNSDGRRADGVTSVLTLCGNLPRRFASSNAASKSYGYEWTDYAQDTRPVQHRGRVALPDVPALTENVEGPGDEQAGGNLLREALSPPPDPKMIRSRARTGTAEVPLFPMSHLPVFSLLFAFGEII
jgi:hypothetical protein